MVDWSALASATNQFLNLGWNVGSQLYQWQREDKYNALTREREDTAIQRRVADLKAAGLSPVLAAGSAAQTSNPIVTGAKPVSGDIVGAARDTAIAGEGLKQMRERTEQERQNTEQSRIMTRVMRNNSRVNAYDTAAELAARLYSFGFNPEDMSITAGPDGDVKVGYLTPHREWSTSDGVNGVWTDSNSDFANSPYMQLLRQNYANEALKNSLLNKENSWYNFNQGVNAFGSVVGTGLDVAGTILGARNFNRQFSWDQYKYANPQEHRETVFFDRKKNIKTRNWY